MTATTFSLTCLDWPRWLLAPTVRPGNSAGTLGGLLCYDGQVRIYAPHLGLGDGDLRHRSWSYDEATELGYQEFLQLLRDECTQRIYYPEGRDALRVFSRVRGHAREQMRMALSDENRRVWDEWDEEVKTKEAEIRRLQDRIQQVEVDNDRLERRVDYVERQNRILAYQLRSNDRSASGGYDAPEAGGDDEVPLGLRTVAQVVDAVQDWPHVRVFHRVRGECEWMSTGDAQRFYDVLVSLNVCGTERASIHGESLGSREHDWVRERSIDFIGGESNATMSQYGHLRSFQDDDGVSVEMQPHIRIGDWRVHLCWNQEESKWLVGYYGQHLLTVTG